MGPGQRVEERHRPMHSRFHCFAEDGTTSWVHRMVWMEEEEWGIRQTRERKEAAMSLPQEVHLEYVDCTILVCSPYTRVMQRVDNILGNTCFMNSALQVWHWDVGEAINNRCHFHIRYFVFIFIYIYNIIKLILSSLCL